MRRRADVVVVGSGPGGATVARELARAGKSVILLSYPDEGHGLSKRANRIDLTKRMIEFFDHYLMDVPAPDWIKNGVPFNEKKKNDASPTK